MSTSETMLTLALAMACGVVVLLSGALITIINSL